VNIDHRHQPETGHGSLAAENARNVSLILRYKAARDKGRGAPGTFVVIVMRQEGSLDTLKKRRLSSIELPRVQPVACIGVLSNAEDAIQGDLLGKW
jgi:hypothetical protein